MPAPKGNKYALGNMGPPKQYLFPEDMQEIIDVYFDDCKKDKRPFSIEGLAFALNLDRQGLLSYQKAKGYEDYYHTIKKAKAKILQNKIENGLNGTNNTAFAIFDLKNNFGFKDKTEVITKNAEIKINEEDLQDKSPAEIARYYRQILGDTTEGE